MKVYGIPNCNTVKKAIDWLKQNEVEYEFHDFKKEGITKEKLQQWAKRSGWEKLVNKKGTTWRSLGPEKQAQIQDTESAIELMMEKPSVIKRPLIEYNGNILLGFDEAEYDSQLK